MGWEIWEQIVDGERKPIGEERFLAEAMKTAQDWAAHRRGNVYWVQKIDWKGNLRLPAVYQFL